MNYFIKVNSQNLIGKFIRVSTPYRDKLWQGIITDVIYSLVIPTDEQMTIMYGEDWKDKPCKKAQKALDFDRVKFIDEFTGNPIVMPLNPHNSTMVWELDLK